MMLNGISPRLKAITSAILLCVLTVFVLPMSSGAALGASSGCNPCICSFREHPKTRDGGPNEIGGRSVKNQHELTWKHIKREFSDQELWFLEEFLLRHIIPYLQLMSRHFVTTGMHQAFIIGTFIDSKHELERLRTFSTLAAEAHRDYHPSMNMCVFGTNVRSLAEAERRADFTTFVLSQRAQDRWAGGRNAAGADGAHTDLQSRFHRFKNRYCDINQNGKDSLQNICGTNAPVKTRSRDINYSDMLDQPLTLEIDFSDAEAPTDDEIDIFSLADNLYANELMTRMQEVDFNEEDNHLYLTQLRSVFAKRSVLQHSFNNLVGIKAMGSVAGEGDDRLTSADTMKYMGIILQQMGIDAPDVPKILGENPSYYAQMDVLTRKLYQRPEFYSDLSEQPANIDRKAVSLLAIEMMQNFDMWESHLRQEAMLSVWLEMLLQKKQEALSGRIENIKKEGREQQDLPE